MSGEAEVTRYDLSRDALSACYCGMGQTPAGTFVFAAEYDAMRAERDALVNDANEWRSRQDEYRALLAQEAAILTALQACEAERDAAVREREEAREVVTWANNSLYGSLGYFVGDKGKFHLAKPIEDLKRQCRNDMAARTEAEAKLASAQKVMDAVNQLQRGDVEVAMVALSVCADVQRAEQGGDGADACDRVASELSRIVRALTAPTTAEGEG